MITEDYVSFETAKLLKEKGFDTPLNYYYTSDSRKGYATTYNWNQTTGDFPDYSCPTLQMAMKWLREVHKLHIILRISRNTFLYGFKIVDNKGNIPYVHNFVFDYYEQACEAGIKYCLENLI